MHSESIPTGHKVLGYHALVDGKHEGQIRCLWGGWMKTEDDHSDDISNLVLIYLIP